MNLWQKTAAGLVSVGVAATTGIAAVEKFDRYEDPADKGVIETALEAVEPEMRAGVKAHVLAETQLKSFKKDGISVEINYIVRVDDMVSVDFFAYRNGERLNVSTPYMFKNPPIKIPTGKYHKELVNGEEVDVANFEENPEEVLKEIIIQTILLQNP